MNSLPRVLRNLPLLVTLCILLVACGTTTATAPTGTTTTTAATTTLNVFAAASLTESFGEIATNYQKAHPNIAIKANFAGSQLLEQQISQGAPSDIFASADLANMQKATDAGLVSTSQIFAQNKLVVIIPVGNPGKITTLKDLANKGVKIDIEAPTVPAGKYSLQILDKMAKSPDYGAAYETAVKGNIVSQEDNVKAVVTKVQLGEADAGYVYQTDVTAAVASKVTVIPIPDNFNVIAQYPIALVKKSAHSSDAQAFIDYILSTDGQATLAKYHFIGAKG